MYKKYELSPEAKARKVAYVGKYNKEIYNIYTFKLRKEDDAKLIEAIKNSGLSVCALAKIAIEKYFGSTK